MELAELESLIKSRRSIRRWQNKKVPVKLLLHAVKLATWAPNGGNQQNWYFYLILNKDIINAMANAVQDKANKIASWPEVERMGIATRLRERSDFFRDAPAVIAVAAAPYQTQLNKVYAIYEKTEPIVSQIRKWREIVNTRIQSVASATAYLLLVMHQMGLGAVWMTAPTLAKGEIERILQIPPELDIVALIPVGYPADSPASTGRKSVEEVCEVIR